MKHLFIFLFFFQYLSFAQRPNIDSLYIVLAKTTNTSEQLSIRLQLRTHEPLESASYLQNLEELLKLCKQLNNQNEELETLKKIKNYYGYKGDFDKYLQQSIEYANKVEKLKLREELIVAYHAIAQSFVQINKFEQAQKYINLGYKNIKTPKDSVNLWGFIEQESFIAYYRGDFKKCLDLHFKALKFAQKYNSGVEIADILNEIGLTYIQLKQYDLAVEYLNKALKMNEKWNSNAKNQKLAFIYSDLGLAYTKLNNNPMALASFNKCLELVKLTKDIRTEMETYRYIAEFYKNQGNYKEQNINLIKYHQIKDSLYNNDNRLKMMDLENQYTLQKKNSELAIQEAENLKHKNQRNIFVSIAIISGLVISFLLFFFNKIKTKNIQIEKQKVALEDLNKVKDRLFAILGHDLRTPLASLKMLLELDMYTDLPTEKKQRYFQNTLNEVNKVTNLLENLLAWANIQLKRKQTQKTKILLFDFLQEIEEQIRTLLDAKSIKIEYDLLCLSVETDKSYLEIIIRNIFLNAIKYSFEGGEILVSSSTNQKGQLIEIQDFGAGMNPEKVNAIKNMSAQSSVGT
nr:tetratricopeptide repeat protein [Spirosomataceae bacterium]